MTTACAGGSAPVSSPGPPAATTQPASAPTLPGPSTLPPVTSTTVATREVIPTPSPRRAPATATPAEGTRTIVVGDYYFDPQVVTVTVGTVIIWHPVGELVHTIVPLDPPSGFRPGATAGAGSPDYDFTFNSTGSYHYTCDYHPGVMDAVIVVVEGS